MEFITNHTPDPVYGRTFYLRLLARVARVNYAEEYVQALLACFTRLTLAALRRL